MKTWKSILALVLVVLLCVSMLAACASKTDADDSGKTSSNDSAPSDGTENPSDDAQDSQTPEDASEPEDLTEIVVLMPDVAGTIKDKTAVEDALNEISEAEIGVHVTLQVVDFGNYGTQLSLALSGGEKVDLACATPSPGSDFGTIFANGQAMNISPYLESAGQAILDEASEYLNAFTFAGEVYGVPVLRQKATDGYYCYRQDIVDELGLNEQAQSLETWADVAALMQAATADQTGMYGVSGQQMLFVKDSINDPTQFAATAADLVGDSLYLVYVEDGTVKSLFEQPDYVASLELAAQWYNDGLVYTDTFVNLDTDPAVLTGQGVSFSFFAPCDIAVESSKEMMAGCDLTCVQYYSGILTTRLLQLWSTFVPATAEEPEAAVKFLNLAYSNADVMNLINWGLEGTDYVINDAGEAAYPDGNGDAATYHQQDFVFGNSFLALPWDGSGADCRELGRESLEQMTPSDYLGFALDTGDLTNTIGALTSVITEYAPSLYSGLYSEALYQDFLEALDNAGLQDYIAAIQAQLDTWSAENS